MEKPKWLKKRISNLDKIEETTLLMKTLSLNTVCAGADCPNIGECYANGTATFMILGSECTRRCKFCVVSKGKPELLNAEEPMNVGKASKTMNLKHTVVTSVTRDDLIDGGAEHFAETVAEIRKHNPNSTIELLIPDLCGDWEALKTILDSKPDIINHNIETVSSLYGKVRPEANYLRSLELLKKVKEYNPKIYTKSGIMVGLGENEEEMVRTIIDLRSVDCDILTIGQYLQPSDKHLEVAEYITPSEFEIYEKYAKLKGFKFVASGTFVRSSYNAGEALTAIKNHEYDASSHISNCN